MSARSGKSYRSGHSDVPDVGPVTWRVEETHKANGDLHIRVLLEARYTQTREAVTRDDHMKLIAAAIGAFW